MRGSRVRRALDLRVRWAVICSGLVVSCAAIPAASASQRVIEESTDSRTVVRVDAETQEVGDYLDRFAVAVGAGGQSRLRVLELRTRPMEGEPNPLPRIDSVRIGDLRRVRHTWLRHVDVPRYVKGPTGQWREVESVVVAVEHPDLRASIDALGPREAREEARTVAPGVVNRATLGPQLLRRAQAPVDRRARKAPIQDTFAQSPRWIRLEVERGGIYRLDAADLRTALGAEADLVDPATVRIFAAPTSRVSSDPTQPGQSWEEGYALRERAIYVESTGGTLGSGDSIWFFTAGPDDWRDRFDPSAGLWEFDDRVSSTRLALWLTYDRVGETEPSSFVGSPLRMARVDATPTGGARVLGHARSRLHFEQNLLSAFGRVQDNWAWKDRIETGSNFRHFIDLPHAHTDSSAWLESVAVMDPPPFSIRFVSVPLPDHEVDVSWNGTAVTHWTWAFGTQNSPLFAPIRFREEIPSVRDGLNDITFANVSGSQDGTTARAPQLIIDEFNLAYRRDLELDGTGLHWVLPPTEAALADRVEFRLSDGGQGLADAVVLDTTDPWAPRWLDGQVMSAGAELHVETAVAPSGARFVASFRDAALRPVVVRAHRPRRLREEVSAAANGGETLGYDMVILHPASLRSAAETLADYRRGDLEGSAGARVAAVDLQDVYDEFGSGTKDPSAIRNYLEFLFHADPRLRFALLLGDGNRDARGVIQNSAPDLCPVWVQTHWPSSPLRSDSLVPYARDDYFVSFDVAGNSAGLDTPDVAIGRLPVGDVSEARQMVQRIIDYENAPASGTWRDTMLLAADDEVGLAHSDYRETGHIIQAEKLRRNYLPPALDIDQLYLTEFPTVPGGRGKPRARQQLQSHWSDGRLIVQYIGHGSPEQMADENLFRIEDIPSLTNANRRSLFLAFSCDVSIFDDPLKRSMSEQLVLNESGGAIATVAATQVTYSGPNDDIQNALYQNLWDRSHLDRSTPLGVALWRAKIATFASGSFTQHNGAKYVLLGDPSLRLQSPSESLDLGGALSQQIVSGQLVDLSADSRGLAGGGRWYVLAEESADSVRYVMDDGPKTLPPGLLLYQLVGSPFYRGEGELDGSTFQTHLRTPAFMEFGPLGRVRVIVEDGAEQWVGVADSLLVSRGVPDTDDSQGPTIELSFANAARRVTPGMTLSATLSDSSGINILGTVPANTIRLEFDDSGAQSDVTDMFVFDSDDYRRGTIQLPLPSTLSAGEHTLALSASDMMGNLSTESSSFVLVPEGLLEIGNHAPFPNPFREATRFVLEVVAPPGVPSNIELSVYTVDGQPVRTLRDRLVGGGGRLAIPWDGQDSRGRDVANGTYLYTVRVDFLGARASSQTATGRVVRMR